MEIIVSKEDHIDIICKLLWQHFTNQNAYLGMSYYQSNLEIIEKHVKNRIISNDKTYKYFSMIDENADFIGFVNLLIDNQRGEILVVLYNNKDITVCKNLLDYGIQYLKNNGVKEIYAESFAGDKFYEDNLVNCNGKLLSQKWII
ncbi:MAG: hypothetical protein V3575_00295 [Candidatus Absconditabacteria bacterium]